MAITLRQVRSNHVTIAISGQFDVRKKDEIHEVIAWVGMRAHYRFDLGKTSKLHHTGVGLLISLRQQLGGRRANISLHNCSEEIMRVLERAGLLQLFPVYPVLQSVGVATGDGYRQGKY